MVSGRYRNYGVYGTSNAVPHPNPDWAVTIFSKEGKAQHAVGIDAFAYPELAYDGKHFAVTREGSVFIFKASGEPVGKMDLSIERLEIFLVAGELLVADLDAAKVLRYTMPVDIGSDIDWPEGIRADATRLFFRIEEQ